MALTDQQIKDIRGKVGLDPNTGAILQKPSTSSGISPRMKRLKAIADEQKNVLSKQGDINKIEEKKPGFLARLGEIFAERSGKIKESFHRSTTEFQSPPETAVQVISQGIGGVYDAAAAGVSAIAPDFIEKPIVGALGAGAKAVGLDKAAVKIDEWAKKHPRAAMDLEGLINIASILPVGKAAEVTSKTALKGAERAIANTAERKALKITAEALEVVKPELSKAEKITALGAGRASKKGVLGTLEIAPSPRDLDVAKSVSGLVSKKKDVVGNIGAVRGAIRKEAESTIVGLEKNNAIFNTSQLSSKLRSIEKPPLLVSDATLNNAYSIAQAKFLDFVNKQPKKLSGLLKARKEFDVWVEKQFPKIFDDARYSPLEKAIKDMRNAANDFVAEKLPDGSIYKNSLRKQNLMYDAISNMAEKAYRDVGTSVIDRLSKKYPTATKIIKYGGAAGIVGTGVNKLLGK